jgi:hypothetical protein
MTIFVVNNSDISGLKKCSIGNDHLNGAACIARLPLLGTLGWGCAASQRSFLQKSRNLPQGMGRSHRDELNNSETMRVRNVIADVKFAKVIF